MNPFTALKNLSPFHFTFLFSFFFSLILSTLHVTSLCYSPLQLASLHFTSLFTFYRLHFPQTNAWEVTARRLRSPVMWAWSVAVEQLGYVFSCAECCRMARWRCELCGCAAVCSEVLGAKNLLTAAVPAGLWVCAGADVLTVVRVCSMYRCGRQGRLNP